MRRGAALVAVLLIVGCADQAGPVATAAATTSTTASPAAASTLPPVVECPGVGDFEEGGGIADFPGESSDSRNIGRITWETSDQCETFHFDFETSEGAPATTVPEIRVDHLESFQVVRINMDVVGTVVTDQLVESNLVERLYVVRSLSGGMFVDLHLAQPAAVRAAVSSSPAQLSLDLRPGFVPFVGTSAVADNVVLTSPTARGSVDAAVQLLGYARTFEANVLALATQGGEVVAEGDTIAADSSETWGEFRLRLQLPSGENSVFVGEETPDDGSLQGVTVDLTVN